MDKLRRKCETLDKEVQDSASFKDLYLFTFNFAKNPGQKSLGMQIMYKEKYTSYIHTFRTLKNLIWQSHTGILCYVVDSSFWTCGVVFYR